MTEILDLSSIARRAKRWVVKVGTSVLTDRDAVRVAKHRVQSIAREVATLSLCGKEVIVVTSGAIGVGMGILNLKARPRALSKLQAAAAVGQGLLMQWYISCLEEEEGLRAAQILLTRGDLEDRRRYLNAKTTLEALLRYKAIPVINENDTVAVDEIRYGDNDLLSAHVAVLAQADLLVILTDVDQLMGPDEPLHVVAQITPEMERAARGTSNVSSTGGMRTKLEAARIAMASGIPMVVMNGGGHANLLGITEDAKGRGTWFLPSQYQLRGRKRWLAFTGKTQGTIGVDAGARKALADQGRSLLATGVRQVEGNFRRGELIGIRDESGHEFARGLVNYSHSELEKIRGMKSEAVAELLGRKAEEVVHRDSMVILQ